MFLITMTLLIAGFNIVVGIVLLRKETKEKGLTRACLRVYGGIISLLGLIVAICLMCSASVTEAQAIAYGIMLAMGLIFLEFSK